MLTLTAGNANPFFRNTITLPDGTVNPANCSHDLVVFAATPRRDQSPVKASFNDAPPNSVPAFKIDPNSQILEADDFAFAFDYLYDLLAWLNKYYVTVIPAQRQIPSGAMSYLKTDQICSSHRLHRHGLPTLSAMALSRSDLGIMISPLHGWTLKVALMTQTVSPQPLRQMFTFAISYLTATI
jgi:hypothetical protein